MIERARTPSDNQFCANRKLILNELGRFGLKADINSLFFEVSLAEMEEREDAYEQESTE